MGYGWFSYTNLEVYYLLVNVFSCLRCRIVLCVLCAVVTEYVLMRLCAVRAWKVCDSASSFEVFEPSIVHSSVELLLARCT
jgi:hypothetical protein